MSLTASDKGSAEFVITPEGQYVGRCFKIIDMGTQTITGKYGVQDKHKVMISWELWGKEDDVTTVDNEGHVTVVKEGAPIVMEDGRPFSVYQFYTITLSDKGNLRPALESWRGRKFTPKELEGFNLIDVLGAYCTIQVVHDETGKYPNVQTIMKYVGEKPKPVNPNVVFDIDNPDMEVFNAMSDNMKAKITNTPEWKFNHQPAKAEPSKPLDDVIIEDVSDKPLTEANLGGEPIDTDEIPF